MKKLLLVLTALCVFASTAGFAYEETVVYRNHPRCGWAGHPCHYHHYHHHYWHRRYY